MTAYSAVISLKQELELLLTSPRLSGPTLGMEEYEEVFNKVHLVDSLLRDAMGSDSYFRNPIRNAVVSAKNDLEILLRKEEFEKFYDDVRLMDSLLTDMMRENYSRSDVRKVIASLEKDIAEELKPVFYNEELQKLHHDIELMNSLLTDSFRGGCSQISGITDVVISIKKALEPSSRKAEFQKIYDNVRLMDSLIRDSSRESYDPERMGEFEDRIRDVANKASNCLRFEDHLEVFLNLGASDTVPLFKGRRASADPPFKHAALLEISEEIAYLNDELKKIQDLNDQSRKIQELREVSRIALAQNSGNAASNTDNFTALLGPSGRSQNKDGKLVGLKKDLEDMLDCLIGQSQNFKVFTVIGMAGIGKTTFVKELYNHPLVAHRFDVRAWASVSQEYQLRGLLLGLIRGAAGNLSDVIFDMTDEQLKEQLYRSLKGKRHLIVLDDVWDVRVWEDLRTVFQNDKNGSRVLLTSRLHGVAIHANPDIPPHSLRCLTPEESWELLSMKIFPNGLCPQEMLLMGKEIAHKCHGLPLALVVVGGLLSKMDKTLRVWEEVAQNVGSLVMDDPQHCQNILALSYNHLPDSLKTCFLYMGIFPEDYEISSKKLIRLWIAEGFVRPKKEKGLEEIAEDYLEDLVARSIVMGKRRPNGRIKKCQIHDLMRDFCLRESRKVSFLHVIHNHGEMPEREIRKDIKKFLEKDMHNLPRLALYTNLHMFMKIRASFPFTRSFFCFEDLRPTDVKCCSGIRFKSLKVLDVTHVHLPSLPSGIFLLTSLKFLAATIHNYVLLSELSKLQSLQTCIIDCESSGLLPREFWDMTELRHIYLKRRSSLSHHLFVVSDSEFSGFTILQNIQSLSTIGPSCCTREIFLRMPNLTKLGVHATEEDYQFLGWFENLAFLTKLETLKYAFSIPFASSRVKPEHLPPWDVFPPNLKKLTLSGTSFPWEDMHQLSLLPQLEVLKLRNFAFSGAVWDLGDSCFKCLKFLVIGSTNLEVWGARGSHFPSLEHLILRYCRSLKEIPYGLSEAPLLNKIELHSCGSSATASARQLQEELQNSEDDWLTVYVTGT